MRAHYLTMLPLALSAQIAASAEGRFVDAEDLFARHGEALTTAAFEAGVSGLQRQFDDVCGDTFCEGDYSNLASLAFACSVNEDTKKVGDCVWTFAGSYADVDGDTGELRVKSRTFDCNLGFGGSAQDLATFLRTAASAHALTLSTLVVPGTQRSLYDVLTGCL